MGDDEWWRIEQRLRRLNELGYDVARLDINEVDGNPHVMVQTQVVEAGHHRRRLLDLTGLDVGENQARRILNDLDTYRSQAVHAGDPGRRGHGRAALDDATCSSR